MDLENLAVNCRPNRNTTSNSYFIVPSFGSPINQVNVECLQNNVQSAPLLDNTSVYNGSVRLLWSSVKKHSFQHKNDEPEINYFKLNVAHGVLFNRVSVCLNFLLLKLTAWSVTYPPTQRKFYQSWNKRNWTTWTSSLRLNYHYAAILPRIYYFGLILLRTVTQN